MAESQTYKGSCHCGNVRFEVDTDLKGVMSCNCSLCQRAGYLLHFVPESQFRLLSGESDLRDYQFNKHKIHHLFCTNCGVRSFERGQQGGQSMRAINVRCLEDVDLDKLEVKKNNGRVQ
jgi:hypothetical protein